MIKKILLSILSSIAILFVLEILFRSYTNYVQLYDIEMHRYALHLKKKSSNASLSHEHILNKKINLMGVNVSINSSGFRGAKVPSPSPDQFRILVLGDSVTFGWGVPWNDVYTQTLQKKINDLYPGTSPVLINAGVGNYNLASKVALLEDVFSQFRPDFVILQSSINDSKILPKSNSSFLLKYSLLAAYTYIKLQQLFYFSKGNYQTLDDYYFEHYKDSSPGWKQSQDSFVRAKDFLHDKKTPFLILVTPDLHEIRTDSLQNKCQRKITTFLNMHQIQFLDLHSTFANQDLSKIWITPEDTHPNSIGHKLISDALLNYLMLHEYLTPNSN